MSKVVKEPTLRAGEGERAALRVRQPAPSVQLWSKNGNASCDGCDVPPHIVRSAPRDRTGLRGIRVCSRFVIVMTDAEYSGGCVGNGMAASVCWRQLMGRVVSSPYLGVALFRGQLHLRRCFSVARRFLRSASALLSAFVQARWMNSSTLMSSLRAKCRICASLSTSNTIVYGTW